MVLDNLSTGALQLGSERAVFVEGNIGDQSLVRTALRQHRVDAVIHFAASTIVPESMAEPLKY